MSEHEHEEECEAAAVVTPCWEWNWLEVPSVTLRVIAGSARCLGQGLDAIATELMAAAEYQRRDRAEARERWEQDVARAEMAGYLEGQVLFDEPRAVDPRDFQ